MHRMEDQQLQKRSQSLPTARVHERKGMGKKRESAAPAPYLRIKVSVCKRYAKEITYYGKEVEKQNAKIERMRKDGKSDEFDIKKQIQVREESEEMIPTVMSQLSTAKSDLKKFMVSSDANEGKIEDAKFYAEAKSIVSADS
eukprot:g3629.t1